MTAPIVPHTPTTHQINRTAKYIDSVLWVLCSTAQRWYRPVVMRATEDLIWASCPFCDKMGRIQDEPGYDASEPQPHPYFLESTLAFEGRA